MNDERVVRPQLILENLLFYSNREDYNLRRKRDIYTKSEALCLEK